MPDEPREASTGPVKPPAFRVRTVLAGGVRAWARDAIPFAAIGAVVHAPWIAYLAWRAPPPAEGPGTTALLLSIGVEWLLATVAGGLVTFGVLTRLSGRRPGTLRVIGGGLAALPRAVAAGALVTLAIVGPTAVAVFADVRILGFVALLVAAETWLAVPAAVAEGLGPRAAWSRGRALLSTSLLQSLGVMISMALAGFATLAIADLATGTPLLEPSRDADLVRAILSALVYVPFRAAVAAAGYHDRRHVVDGLSSEQIAAVFD